MARKKDLPAPAGGVSRGFGWGLLAAVGVLAVLGLSLWNRAARGEAEVTSRLAALENRLDGLEKSVQAARNQPQPPAQPRRGVDENKVYTVNTAGAPIKGPGGAAVTIVEVSDFQ